MQLRKKTIKEKDKNDRWCCRFFNKKIQINEKYIRITFYELRIKYNLSEEETEEILEEGAELLKSKGYLVYFTNSSYLILIKERS